MESKLRASKRPPRSVQEVGVTFIGDPAMRRLNAQYRGKDRPTDVLSFPQLEGAVPEREIVRSLGDVVISLATAERQAAEYGVTFSREMLRLLIHGMLHLCGFDHENVSAQRVREMQRMEDYLFMRHARSADRW